MVWVIMRQRGVSPEHKRSSWSSLCNNDSKNYKYHCMFLLLANIFSDFQRSLRFNSLTHSLRFNLLQAKLLWGNTCKNMCLHYIWFLHFNMIQATEVFLIKNKDISYLVNTLAADGLVMKGVMASAAMTLTYRKISNISYTKSQNFNDSPLVLHLSLPNLFKPGVK